MVVVNVADVVAAANLSNQTAELRSAATYRGSVEHNGIENPVLHNPYRTHSLIPNIPY